MGTILVGKRKEKRPHGRPRHKYEDKMGLKETWECVVWLKMEIDGGIL